jgi:putative oxidoreductase
MQNIEAKKLVFPGLAGLYNSLAPLAPTLVRVSLGLILLPHGYGKLFLNDAVGASRNFVNFGWAFPLAWAYAIGVLEFFGGLMLVFGLLTRPVALAVSIQMAVISFAVLYPNWGWSQRGMEFALFMGLIAISILMAGGGRYSLDRLLRKEL